MKDSTSRPAVHPSLSATSSRRPPLSRAQSGQAVLNQNDPLSRKSSQNSSGSTGSAGSISGPGTPASSTSGGLNESRRNSGKHRSLSQVLASNLLNTNQYLAQEKAYLKRIRTQYGDDYYTKGITAGGPGADRDLEIRSSFGGSTADDDADDDDLSSYGHSEVLAEPETEKYQFDSSLAFAIMRESNSKLSIDGDLQTISRDSIQDPGVIERLEWQAMLLSVLTGDVVRSEKTKIIDTVNPADGSDHFLRSRYRENLWFGIRAKLFGRSVDDQKKITLYRRNQVDSLIEEVRVYEISYSSDAPSPREQIVAILDRYSRACELWRTLEDMRHDKPACRDEEFQDRIDALNAWLSISDAIERESNSFKAWIGNDDLDVTRGRVEPAEPETGPETRPETRPETGSETGPETETSTGKSKVKRIFEEDNKSLAERIVKEKDVHRIFRQRIFLKLAPWMVKSKKNYIRLSTIFETLKLPDYVRNLIDLCLVPMRLIKEIIEIRMRYAQKLQNPTLMMIDQMIDDLKSYIAIAMEIKSGIIDYCKSDVDRIWYIKDMFDHDIEVFDKVVLSCVRYYLSLLNKKLNDSSRSPHLFRTNKEPEELESAWHFLRNLGEYIDGGGSVVAENVTSVATRLCHKLLSYLYHQVNNPPTPVNGSADFTRWYMSTTENFGQLRRKLARFTGQISQKFTNSFVFEVIAKASTEKHSLLDVLRETDHFLVFTSTVEAQGMYFFASSELIDNEAEILRIISGSSLGSDPEECVSEFSDLITAKEHDFSDYTNFESPHNPKYATSYVITYCPSKPIVWNGQMINLKVDNVPISDLKPGQLLLISNLPHFSLHMVRDRFLEAVTDPSVSDTLKAVEQRSSLTKVHQELTKINKLFFRMTLAVFDSVTILTSKCREMLPGGDYQELVNSNFIHARDFGKSSVKWSDTGRKSTIIMRLIGLAIDWVSFICDDCIPTDRKTFRWCVLALEFAMEMTRGFNILVLDEDQFYNLKMKVARCMSLLISHFDIMGARSSEAEQKRLQKWYSQKQGIEKSADDDEILSVYQEDLMAQISEIEAYRSDVQEQLNSIGRVMDVSDSEYQFVTLLASSFSSVSIRWQKGKFIGGGSFGQVYAAVNLDTGGVMAVKEIVFHDSQSLKLIPSIKEEMTVLEMLNHPNVVQYFGVEVHRDKVYIFMEFCEGGSLSGLLAHGRIEDEMVIQVYTLQMLEGLAYLHQSGVVHRDIKPENILLDHNGVIKFVDFGAAKVIAASGRTRNTVGRSSSAAANNAGGNNPQNLNSMTGTPMYMSPEVITGQATSKSGVVDIWSLGCCVLEMATGRRPWANLDNEWAIMYHIAAGHKPQLPSSDQLSEAGIKFLSKCLEHDPSKRPSSAELLNDPWIIQIRQAAFGTSEGTTPSSEYKVEF